MRYEFHPAANAFPMMDSNRFSELLDDIREHGQHETITLCEGMILDGRNRYKACTELGIVPKTKTFEGDPWAFAWSLNGQRRDLVDEQRYLIWKFCHENSEAFQAEKRRIQDEANRARAEAAKTQENRGNQYTAPKSQEQSAVELVNGDEFNEHVEDLKVEVREQSVHVPAPSRQPERKAKATSAKVNLGAVARGDKLADARPDLAAKVRLGEMKPAEAHRQLKKDEVAEKAGALPEGKYRIIYADPPWKYNDAQAVKGDYGTGTGAANCHYPSMTVSELKALDIPSLAADDSVLFLWATCPLLEDALEICRAWGFKYKAQFIWDKVKHNMGHYNSVRHELLLICTKGSCTPDNVKLYDSVQVIERTEHSRKPEQFREIIDTIYPHGPRIELFRRGEAPEGWSVWGNES